MRTLLVATDLAKTYGRQAVLDGLSFAVHDRQRIALIGRNGAGKTTLLRILAGEEAADRGTVTLVGGARLGVLRQNEVLPADGTALDWLAASAGCQSWEAERLAARFGLRSGNLDLAPTELSGGYQMRLKIVRMLLANPDLLLLDEPVNYLDLPTIVLLESFLRRWPGAFIVTSHDREILNKLCTTTWEVAGARLVTHDGDVESYLDWKDERAAYLERTNKKLRREMADAQAFVERFRFKASKASQAQSRLKHIAKLRTRLKDLDPDLPTAAFRVECPPYVPGTALRCRDLAVGYGERRVAAGVEIEFPRGVKVGIVGENGRGKSTLLKTLAGILPPLSGEAKWWHRADVGYFAQHSEDALLPGETVLQAITRAAPPDATPERLLATAGAFLFRGDDLEKPCGVLSGGERSRVRLACLVLRGHNVLLLDEPTNHLDAETVEVLAEALKEYRGTVVVVSHARTFMNALVERLYEVHDGTVREFRGSYEEYVADLSARAEAGELLAEVPGEDSAAAKRAARERERTAKRGREKVEARLKALEGERGAILKFFFENPLDYDPDKQRRLADLEEEIARAEGEWFRLAE